MLTIQSNFSKPVRSATTFGLSDSNRNYSEIEDLDNDYLSTGLDNEPENDEFVSRDDNHPDKDETLADFKENVNQAVNDLKDIEQELPLPPAAKKVLGGLCTLGAAAVTGISMKFGVSESGRVLGKLSQKQSVKAVKSSVSGSLSKLGKAIKNCFNTIKNTSFVKTISSKVSKAADKFKATGFGKKITKFFDKLTDNKFANKVKGLFKSVKKVDGKNVVDRTGDVLGTATGVSTAAVGFIEPDKNAKVEG